ncbi:phage major capsid protein [Clostridium botulinum]|uniref:phage major capsid protein n=1 Tax=Clostridium botulinum TaxID=1491 RepID=UPI00217E5940|nr:phage major capsid protein [Clostridium botulinum]MCS6103578.1 phage major capsid protein [Clostridium botulinum]MCS6107246.1 phage major capsid protein [Clostridium botulinum]
MSNIKAIIEKRNSLIEEMESLVNKATEEVRAFDETENARVEEIKTEVRGLEEVIKANKDKKSKMMDEEDKPKKNKDGKEDMNMEKRSIAEELVGGSKIDLNSLETRATVTEGISTGGNVAIGKDIVGQTWADSIIRQVEYVSPLYGMANKINTTSPHNIPLQGNKIGKFVKTAELGTYKAQLADFKTKTLGAVKYTNLFTVSNELMQDSMYNIEAELIAQTKEALTQTLDELVIKGDKAEGVEGLEMLPSEREIVAGGVKKISEADLLNMFYGVKSAYRQNAVWIFNDATCRELAKLKDAQGRPLLTQSYNVAPVGSTETTGVTTFLLGKPVIVNDFVPSIDSATVEKCAYFGDFNKVMTIGLRKNFEMQKSLEVGFLEDYIAVKSSIRLDAKLIDEKAMVSLKSKIA